MWGWQGFRLWVMHEAVPKINVLPGQLPFLLDLTELSLQLFVHGSPLPPLLPPPGSSTLTAPPPCPVPKCQSPALAVSPANHPLGGPLFTLLTPDPQTFLGDSSVIPQCLAPAVF